MTRKLIIIAGTVAILGSALVGLSALFSLPVWLLWNWLAPVIFALPKITWFQAWGLTALCSFLFKSPGASVKTS